MVNPTCDSRSKAPEAGDPTVDPNTRSLRLNDLCFQHATHDVQSFTSRWGATAGGRSGAGKQRRAVSRHGRASRRTDTLELGRHKAHLAPSEGMMARV
jgi:hypothetical protein